MLHARSNIGKGLHYEKYPTAANQHGMREFQSALTELRSVCAKPVLIKLAFGKVFTCTKKLGGSVE